jgi:hypothetical protein
MYNGAFFYPQSNKSTYKRNRLNGHGLERCKHTDREANSRIMRVPEALNYLFVANWSRRQTD